MDEDQFMALVGLMQAIAYEAAGAATHQPRPQENMREAINEARRAFNLSEERD